jgi:hypothetical protein
VGICGREAVAVTKRSAASWSGRVTDYLFRFGCCFAAMAINTFAKSKKTIPTMMTTSAGVPVQYL